MVEFLFPLFARRRLLSSPRLFSGPRQWRNEEKTSTRSCYKAAQFPIKKHPEVATGS